jgi:hypothetical protein
MAADLCEHGELLVSGRYTKTITEISGTNMIAPSDQPSCEGVPELETRPADYIALARYGRVPQVARFAGFGEAVDRGAQIVVSTDRGEEIAVVLQVTKNRKPETPEGLTGEVIRVATDIDLATAKERSRNKFLW